MRRAVAETVAAQQYATVLATQRNSLSCGLNIESLHFPIQG